MFHKLSSHIFEIDLKQLLEFAFSLYSFGNMISLIFNRRINGRLCKSSFATNIPIATNQDFGHSTQIEESEVSYVNSPVSTYVDTCA